MESGALGSLCLLYFSPEPLFLPIHGIILFRVFLLPQEEGAAGRCGVFSISFSPETTVPRTVPATQKHLHTSPWIGWKNLCEVLRECLGRGKRSGSIRNYGHHDSSWIEAAFLNTPLSVRAPCNYIQATTGWGCCVQSVYSTSRPEQPGGLELGSYATKMYLCTKLTNCLVVDGVSIRPTEERTGIVGVRNSLWFRHTWRY